MALKKFANSDVIRAHRQFHEKKVTCSGPFSVIATKLYSLFKNNIFGIVLIVQALNFQSFFCKNGFHKNAIITATINCNRVGLGLNSLVFSIVRLWVGSWDKPLVFESISKQQIYSKYFLTYAYVTSYWITLYGAQAPLPRPNCKNFLRREN